MIFGNLLAVRRPNRTMVLMLMAGFVMTITLYGLPVEAEDWQLAQLMQLLAHHTTGQATFVEKKYLALLDQPVVSSGTLTFAAPDQLVKITLQPRFERMLLAGDQLSIEQAGMHTVRISLQQHPEITAFIESIRSTLMGDRATLELYYVPELSGSQNQWQLVLTPRQTRMLKVINRIRIEGRQSQVDAIGFDQPDGDHDEMAITPTDGS